MFLPPTCPMLTGQSDRSWYPSRGINIINCRPLINIIFWQVDIIIWLLSRRNMLPLGRVGVGGGCFPLRLKFKINHDCNNMIQCMQVFIYLCSIIQGVRVFLREYTYTFYVKCHRFISEVCEDPLQCHVFSKGNLFLKWTLWIIWITSKKKNLLIS